MTLPVSTYLPFYIAYLVLGTIERVTSTFSSKRKPPIQKISENWFRIPFYAYLALIISSVAEFFLHVKMVTLTVSITGFVLYFLGAFLRRRSISDLGENWSIYSEVRPGHVLVTDGIFRFLKHPYYLAVMLELTGASLVANAYFTVLLVFIIQLPLLVLRIHWEERLLSGYFGDEYRKYVSRKLF